MPPQEVEQFLAGVVGHQRAQRVLETGHEPTRAHCVLVQNARQIADIDALHRVRRNLDSFESESFYGLQTAIERRRLDCDQGTRTSPCLPREVQRLQRASCDDDLVGRDSRSCAQIAARYLTAKLCAATREVLNGTPG